jgi:hypothetical protein
MNISSPTAISPNATYSKVDRAVLDLVSRRSWGFGWQYRWPVTEETIEGPRLLFATVIDKVDRWRMQQSRILLPGCPKQ